MALQQVHHRKKKIPLTPYLMLLPCMVVFGCFVFYPFIRTVYLSLFLTDATGQAAKFYNFKHYAWLFNNKYFWNSVVTTIKFAALVGIPTFVLGFILALMANDRLKNSRIYETLYSLPLAVASAPAAAIWFLIYSSGSGILNYILNTDTRWLTDSGVAIYSVAAVTVWMQLGTNFIFLLTGFRNVPDELIESSTIEGAGYFRRLFRIIIPVASPQIFFVVFLDICNAFQAFTQVKLLTQGGPAYSTEVMVYNIYRLAFIENRFDRACAMSVILFLMIFIVTRVQLAIEKRGVYYA